MGKAGLCYNRVLRAGAAWGVASLLVACGDASLRSPEMYLSSYSVIEPSDNRVVVCHGYECRIKSGVSLNGTDIARLNTIMAGASQSAARERAAIARAIGWLERRVGPEAGTSEDRDYRDLASGGFPGQLDCIDEAANTTSYLMLLRRLGLVQRHTIGHPVSKGFLLNGTYPHVTAVLIEKSTDKQYAIDSWVFANGEEPLVMDLENWKNTSSPEMYQSRHS